MTNPGLSGGRAMLELAERVVKADPAAGNDLAYLDLDIHRAIGNPDAELLDAPAYTASLDAAMTLVSEGPDCSLWWGTRGGKVIATTEIDGAANSLAATPALALCAAALRARAADTPSVKP